MRDKQMIIPQKTGSGEVKGLAKLNIRHYIYLIVPLILVIILSGCASGYYVTARRLHQRGNFVGAIENYDEFIDIARDGAMKVRAYNYRSDAYYQMGVEAMEDERYRLAIRLFYLANSLKADSKMVDSYLTLAEEAYRGGGIERTLQIYNYVTSTFQTLPVIPEVIAKRIMLYHENFEDRDYVWRDYLILVEQYDAQEQIENIKPVIDQYMPSLIADAVALSKSDSYSDAIDELLYLRRYPHSYRKTIEKEIGLLYFDLAEKNKEYNEFFQAHENYLEAVSYNPTLADEVEASFDEMVSTIINYGYELLEQRVIDEAKELFELTYDIIPDNPQAGEAIAKADELAEDIRIGRELFIEAQRHEEEDNWQEALRLYRQSWNRDSLDKTAEKIFLMTNMIEIEEDPIAFARNIITEYNDGIIPQNINTIVNEMEAVYGEDEVRESGWRIRLSTGTNRYEVRYDITSRGESSYLIWQVNLLNRNIVPLNDASQTVMGG